MGSKLFYRHGCMGSGKSLALLAVAENYKRIGQKVKVYTTAMDYRFGEGVVASRAGMSIPAELFNNETVFSIDAVGHDVAAVLVDECQFLTRDQVVALGRIAALHGKPVIAFGLRSDFRGEAFTGSAALAILADKVEELTTICPCGRRANFNIRLDAEGKRVRDGEQIQIGDAQYRAACSTCFYTEDA